MTRTRKPTPRPSFTPATVAEAVDFFAGPFLSSMQSEDVVRCLSALYVDADARRDRLMPALTALGDAGWALYCPDDFYLWRRNDPVAGVRFDPTDPAGATWTRAVFAKGFSSVTEWPVIGPMFEEGT
jgi:hypothetical protein